MDRVELTILLTFIVGLIFVVLFAYAIRFAPPVPTTTPEQIEIAWGIGSVLLYLGFGFFFISFLLAWLRVKGNI